MHAFRLIMIVVFVLCAAASVRAQEKQYPLLVESEYFTIYAYPGMDGADLLERINFNIFLQFDKALEDSGDAVPDVLGKTMDAIFLEVGDVLGIALYSFHGNIKIFSDQESLNAEYRALFHDDFFERAFYLHEKNTLYLSHADISMGIMVHEIAHVLMSHYFVVPPSQKLQEILSGYVEYHFRKRTGTLP
ncbi:MAG: hypothetical protein ACLFPX_00740 [Candidatus Omnitrophota bacterium]